VEIIWRFLRKLKIELPYDPATPLLGVYLKDHHTIDTCVPIFTAALFIIVKLWDHLRCPKMDDWIKKMWYM
jgi:hypothetical protein